MSFRKYSTYAGLLGPAPAHIPNTNTTPPFTHAQQNTHTHPTPSLPSNRKGLLGRFPGDPEAPKLEPQRTANTGTNKGENRCIQAAHLGSRWLSTRAAYAPLLDRTGVYGSVGGGWVTQTHMCGLERKDWYLWVLYEE
eukprot:GDKI01012747.1.p2 GENE.GDKI01012747.1~~GDKI01012747.1.p2  ORF type:complete len:138 (+),score=6.80 GDKI01012747.1:71-484(+)